MAWKNKSLLYTIWSLLFTYLLLDDFFGVHEKVGAIIANRLNLISIFNLRPVDFGEIIVSTCVGLIFFISIAITYRFSYKIDRKICKFLIILLLGLAFFGVVTDMIHVMARNKFIEEILSLIEDGGEHLVMSAIVAFVYFISEQTEQMYVANNKKVTQMLVKN